MTETTKQGKLTLNCWHTFVCFPFLYGVWPTTFDEVREELVFKKKKVGFEKRSVYRSAVIPSTGQAIFLWGDKFLDRTGKAWIKRRGASYMLFLLLATFELLQPLWFYYFWAEQLGDRLKLFSAVMQFFVVGSAQNSNYLLTFCCHFLFVLACLPFKLPS